MNVNAAIRVASRPSKWLVDLRRIGFGRRGWWIVLLLAVGTIVLATFVRSWADCQYFYQAELEHYLAHPDSYGRPPQPPSTPLITVLIRIGGQLLDTAGAWVVWAGGLYLIGLLLGQRELGFGTTLNMVAWSWLPFVMRGLAQCVYMALTHDPIFNSGLSGLIWDNTPPPPGGGYAYVMPTQAQVLGSALLAHLDLYLLWHLGLILSGLRKTGLRLRKALPVTVGVVSLLALLDLLPAILNPGRFRLF